MKFDRDLERNPSTTPFPHAFSASLGLDQWLRLAARYHLGGLNLSDKDLTLLMDKIKQSAMHELELGDGRKVESVRVERKLDGSVSIFFGI